MAGLSDQIHGKHVFADIDDAQRPSFNALRDGMGINGARAFMIAATYGFLTNNPLSEFQPSRSGFARIDTFTYHSGLEMLGLSLGLARGRDIDDFEGCWRECEELAAGGMALLQSHIESQGGIRERIAALVWDELKDIDTGPSDVTGE